MTRFGVTRRIMVLIGTVLGIAAARGAQAMTLALSTCSASELIAAITTANSSAGADTIELKSGCTYALTAPDNVSSAGANGLPVVTNTLTIHGHGDTIARAGGAPAFRIFDFEPPSNATLTLTDLTVTGGDACCVAGGGAVENGSNGTLVLMNATFTSNITGGGNGGAIDNDGGQVVLTNSTISENDSHGGNGGGIYNNGGTLTVLGSTISGNSTADTTVIGNGGGLFTNGGTSTLTNSTVSGNNAVEGAGIDNAGVTNLNNVTIAGNSTVGARDTGGGIFNGAGNTVNLRNSIIALNSDPVGPDCSSAAGGMVSGGYNLIGNADGCNWSAATGDQVGSTSSPINPELGPLEDNGGPTATRALLSGSPAIDAANPTGCLGPGNTLLTTDQRGFVRPVDGDADGDLICDIGAFEFGSQLARTAAPLLSPNALGLVVVVLGLIGATRLRHSRVRA